METWHIWVLVGLVFLGVEMLTPDLVLASVALGMFAAAGAAGAGWSIHLQLGAFMAATLLTMFAVRPRLKRWLHRGGDPRVSGVDALLGRTGVVTEPIQGEQHPGRVKLGGEEWRAVTTAGNAIAAGRDVEVVRVEAATLHVKPA